MSTISNGLYIGYSGLSAAQVGINTTGHNISNAETEGYTRQRVVQSASHPTEPNLQGNGVDVTEIERVFDKFVYDRYVASSEDKEKSDYESDLLSTLSTYFPDINQSGIKEDIHAYFDLWQSLSTTPDSSALKVALSQQAQTLSQNITKTRDQVKTLQSGLNDELKLSIDQVNRYAKEISELNQTIAKYDGDPSQTPNDLYDKRDLLELELSKLVGAQTFGNESSYSLSTKYNVQVSGFNIVDGTSYHPIKLSEAGANPMGFYDLSYERQDAREIPMDSAIFSGKVGAILDLRGRGLNPETGEPTSGTLQEVISELDTFAAGLIESTNNVYARSAVTTMRSDALSVDPKSALVNSNENIEEGSFDIIIYDINGDVSARRTIDVNSLTTLTSSGTDTNSIEYQFSNSIDDNADNDSTNDVDDFLTFNYDVNSSKFSIDFSSPSFKSSGYTFAIEDKTITGNSGGTNFAGGFGLNKFMQGNDASDIGISDAILKDPTTISAYSANVNGNSNVALDMVQLQFENITFANGNVKTQDTIYGYYDSVVTNVGSASRSAQIRNDTITAQFNAIEQEYASVSKVSIDEELTNLIKYQTAYGAAAKIITTIDQMMTTLLGIKS